MSVKPFGIDMKMHDRARKRAAHKAKVAARRRRVQAVKHPVKTALRNWGF